MRYQKGDILVQSNGQPWCWLAELVTGQPFPHAAIVTDVTPGNPHYPDLTDLGYGVWAGHKITMIENHIKGLREYAAYDLGKYEVWRPTCDEATKDSAIAWIRSHLGEGYGYFRLMELVIGYPLGMRTRPGMDNDVSQDGRRKVCSETLAMGYLRAGQLCGNQFDIAPNVTDRDTMPMDLRGQRGANGQIVSELIWSPEWVTGVRPQPGIA